MSEAIKTAQHIPDPNDHILQFSMRSEVTWQVKLGRLNVMVGSETTFLISRLPVPEIKSYLQRQVYLNRTRSSLNFENDDTCNSHNIDSLHDRLNLLPNFNGPATKPVGVNAIVGSPPSLAGVILWRLRAKLYLGWVFATGLVFSDCN